LQRAHHSLASLPVGVVTDRHPDACAPQGEGDLFTDST